MVDINESAPALLIESTWINNKSVRIIARYLINVFFSYEINNKTQADKIIDKSPLFIKYNIGYHGTGILKLVWNHSNEKNKWNTIINNGIPNPKLTFLLYLNRL